jgi:hypothetical protein
MTTIPSQIVRGAEIYLLDDKSFIGYATGQSTPDGNYFWTGRGSGLFETKWHVTNPLPQDVCVPVAAVTHLDPATWFRSARVRLSLTAAQASRLPTRATIEWGGGNGTAVLQTPRTLPMFAPQQMDPSLDPRDLAEIGERALRQMREATQHREKLKAEFGTLSPDEEALLDRQLAVTLDAIRNAYERDAGDFIGGR